MQPNDIANTKRATKRRTVVEMAKTATKYAGCDGGTVINPHRLYTTEDIAALFCKSRRTIERWRKECGLPMSHDARGTVTGRTLLKWLESRGKN